MNRLRNELIRIQSTITRYQYSNEAFASIVPNKFWFRHQQAQWARGWDLDCGRRAFAHGSAPRRLQLWRRVVVKIEDGCTSLLNNSRREASLHSF